MTFVSIPPLLHPPFSLQVRYDKCNWYLLVAKNLVEQAVVALCSGRDFISTNAEQEEIDTARHAQFANKCIRFHYGRIIAIYPRLRLLEANSIPNLDQLGANRELVVLGVHCATFGIRRHLCYVLSSD